MEAAWRGAGGSLSPGGGGLFVPAFSRGRNKNSCGGLRRQTRCVDVLQ